MKKLIFVILIILIAKLFAPPFIQAQGTLYLSNLGEPSGGSVAVGSSGSSAFVETPFTTGTDSEGYVLDSVQLLMGNASGNPTNGSIIVGILPSHGSYAPPSTTSGFTRLTGPANPSTSGIYTYTSSGVTLLPDTVYFIYVFGTGHLAGGTYNWDFADDANAVSSAGWAYTFFPGEPSSSYYFGPDGPVAQNPLQFSINATPIPEPSASWLFLFGSGVLIYVRAAHFNTRKIKLKLRRKAFFFHPLWANHGAILS